MLGVLLSIISAIFASVGTFLQKIGLKKVRGLKDIIKSYKWIIGYSLSIPAFFLYALALKYEKLSIVQPVSNFSVLFLVVLEALIFKEKLKKHEIFALILFFAGIVIIGL